MIRILHGDCREVLKTLPDASVDSIVTDPPYELGFMGKKWDGSGIAHDVAMWAECLRVLKPGGYLLSFAGTRTYHRMTCAIEDAGFDIRDQIGWAFGSGFPKSHNGEWGGTALKPAWEPICMARKPLIGTVEANWREHGTGALNIDGCRIGCEARPVMVRTDTVVAASSMAGVSMGATANGEVTTIGRWPANLCHDGSDEVLAAFPQAPGAQGVVTGKEPSTSTRNNLGLYGERATSVPRSDIGSAARFFYCAKADRADRNAGLHGMPTKDLNWSSGTQSPGTFQSANTNRASENHHPTVKPTDLMRYLCRLVTPAGGTVLDPFLGSGSTLKAAELEGFSGIGIELSAEYIAIAKGRIAGDAPLFAEFE